MEQAVSDVVLAARQAGKASGIVDSRVAFLKRWQERGMRIFSCGSELGFLMKAARATVAEFSGQ
jgi:2-keto-3-deoxy-L-rhamnonate aldolase RhmA